MKARTLLLGAALIAAPALARDPRISTRMYNPDEIVRLDGRATTQATIMFDDDEHIENVAIGNSNSWQVTPNKRANLLFVKPLGSKSRTNLTVVTDRHTYLFDLVAGVGAPVYVLRFKYPEEPKKPGPLATAMSAEEAQAANNPPKETAAIDPADLNFAWRSSGSGKLAPVRVYDDGVATYIAWAHGTPVPAILIRNEKGEEGAVNYAVRGDMIVVEGVPSLLILRSGKEVAMLQNQGPVRPAAAPVVTGPDGQPAKTALAAAPTGDRKP